MKVFHKVPLSRTRRLIRLSWILLSALFIGIIFVIRWGSKERLITKIQRKKATEKPDCYEYNKSASMKRHVIYDVTKTRRHSVDDVTLVTHMTDNRLHRLHLIMKHWEGPISVSIYINKTNIENFLHQLQRRENVVVHFVEAEGEFYPINFMRNLALNTTMTRFVLLNDIDFIPSPGSYKRILNHRMSLKRSEVSVVPVFEEIDNKTRLSEQFPQTKGDLLRLWRQNKVQPFHFLVFEKGQKPTNYEKWAKMKSSYEIKWSRWYEPYVVGFKDDMPKYNEQLVGRYENKALHVAEMKARGYKFTVLSDVFLLHLWHPSKPSRRSVYRCSISISWPYTEYLERKYNVKLMR